MKYLFILFFSVPALAGLKSFALGAVVGSSLSHSKTKMIDVSNQTGRCFIEIDVKDGKAVINADHILLYDSSYSEKVYIKFINDSYIISTSKFEYIKEQHEKCLNQRVK